jgi:hypothetical protein
MTFQPSMDLTQMSNAATQVDNVFRAQIEVAIYTAVQTGARITSSISTVGETEDDLLIVIKELQGLGYTIGYPDSTHITVAWQ